jgi:hypothetical protein
MSYEKLINDGPITATRMLIWLINGWQHEGGRTPLAIKRNVLDMTVHEANHLKGYCQEVLEAIDGTVK